MSKVPAKLRTIILNKKDLGQAVLRSLKKKSRESSRSTRSTSEQIHRSDKRRPARHKPSFLEEWE